MCVNYSLHVLYCCKQCIALFAIAWILWKACQHCIRPRSSALGY